MIIRTVHSTIAAVLFSLFILGCQDSGLSLGMEGKPSTPVVDVYGPQSEQDEPVYSPAPDREGEDKERQDFRFVDFQLLDSRTGIAWDDGYEGLAIHRTVDGGVSWSSLISESEIQAMGLPIVYFLDSEYSWVAITGEDGEIGLSYTSDGGVNWSYTQLAQSGYPSALSFVSPDKGWLLVISDVAMGKSGKQLFKTENGGQDWERIAVTPYKEDAVGRITAELPLNGHIVDLVFQNEEVGWLSLVSPEPVPELYRTLDGGLTWNRVELDMPASLQQDGVQIDHGPVFPPDGEGLEGWLRTRRSEGMQVVYDLYRTTDGGETWIFEQHGFDHCLVFITKDLGWGIKNNVLYSTEDGGLNWEALQDAGISDMLEKYEIPVKLQMVNKEAGWLLLGQGGGGASQLFGTEDGGATWEALTGKD